MPIVASTATLDSLRVHLAMIVPEKNGSAPVSSTILQEQCPSTVINHDRLINRRAERAGALKLRVRVAAAADRSV